MEAPSTGHPKPQDSEESSAQARQQKARLEHLLEGHPPITEDELDAVRQQ